MPPPDAVSDGAAPAPAAAVPTLKSGAAWELVSQSVHVHVRLAYGGSLSGTTQLCIRLPADVPPAEERLN